MDSPTEIDPRPVAATSPRTNRLRAVVVSRKNRSATSNGTTLLANCDGRSLEARRFRDLVVSFSAGLGGFENLDEVSAALVRQAAGVTMQSEVMQAAIVRGERIDSADLVRLSNVLSRVLNALKSRHRPKRAPTLAERLAEAR